MEKELVIANFKLRLKEAGLPEPIVLAGVGIFSDLIESRPQEEWDAIADKVFADTVRSSSKLDKLTSNPAFRLAQMIITPAVSEMLDGNERKFRLMFRELRKSLGNRSEALFGRKLSGMELNHETAMGMTSSLAMSFLTKHSDSIKEEHIPVIYTDLALNYAAPAVNLLLEAVTKEDVESELNDIFKDEDKNKDKNEDKQ